MLYVFLWFMMGLATASINHSRGHSGIAGLLIGLLLGPIGLILAAISPTNQKGIEKRQLNAGSMKKCPFCAELIRSEAAVCKHCGRDVRMPGSAPSSAAPAPAATSYDDKPRVWPGKGEPPPGWISKDSV